MNMREDRRFGTYAVMAHLATIDLTVLWGESSKAAAAAATTRAILQTVANFVDAENGWAAGNDAISAHCDGVSEKTIRRHLKRAEELGLIRRTRKQTGTYRARHRIEFLLDLTQEQLIANAAENPHEVVTDQRTPRVAELEAELERMRRLLVPPENQVAVIMTATHDSAEESGEGESEPPPVAVIRDRFRTGHQGPLPKKTNHINQSSSSGSSTDEVATVPPRDVHEEEDDDDSSMRVWVDDVSTDFDRVQSKVDLPSLWHQLRAAGIDPLQVNLVSAATEVFTAKAGQRIGNPTRYLAVSVAREPTRWPAVTWEQLLAADSPTPARPALSERHPDVIAIAAALGVISVGAAGTPSRSQSGWMSHVNAFVATHPGGWDGAVEWASSWRSDDDTNSRPEPLVARG